MRAFLLLLFFLPVFLSAQLPYTQAGQYAWSVEKDLVYGTAVNYMGFTDTLRLDLYKPLGDNNPQRPLLVLAHGGAWLGGCKNDIKNTAIEMVGRGYVVAAVNYRLGWHKDDYVPAPNCLLDGTQKNLYAPDSCEPLRAIYRGQQDVKGAIRWLKGRHQQDSTDICRVLVGGESAGGFLALATGFLDRPSEKPDCCHAIADAPSPDADLYNQTTLDCVPKFWTIPPGSLERPDLGPVDGEMNLNGYDANVIGVLNFYGGVPYEGLSKDWLGGPDTPAVYLYHQTCDGVVPFGFSQPFYILSAFCNLGCTPWHYNYPHTYGSGSIAAFFDASPGAPCFLTDFINCDAFNPNLALFECARYADNGSYHYIVDLPQRAQNAADFFAPFLASDTCYVAACGVSATQSPTGADDWLLAPNPFTDRLVLHSTAAGQALLDLFDMTGKCIWQEKREVQAGVNEIFFNLALPDGAYVLRVRNASTTRSWMIVKQ
ncbi:MAG: T9SS type A sorting domain-containing protein [Saprospiraceae bacterium]|nr:T9SS type A sorting domain-containing protein [Saprospiraceae bacterium]